MPKANHKILSLLLVLWVGFILGQNSSQQIINRLQGIWIKEGLPDSNLLIIKNTKAEFNFHESDNWGKPHTLTIKNKIPLVPDSVFTNQVITLVNWGQADYYRIITLNDTALILMKYSLTKAVFSAGNEKPQPYLERTTIHFKKVKNLRANYPFKASVFGTWWDEDTKLTLKADSSFSINFSKRDYEYSTCGKFTFNGTCFVLTDLQDKKHIKYHINCDNLTTTPIPMKIYYIKNKHKLFNKNNQIHLYYNWMGLELRENHMRLVRVRD